MRRASLAAGLMIFAGVALRAPAALGDGWKWNPADVRAPAVGDRSFTDFTEKQKQKIKMLTPDGKEDKDETATVSVRYVDEILAVEKSKVTKRRVTYERWSRVVGGETDKSLEGKTVLVTGEGEERTVAIEKDEAIVSDGAKSWLESEWHGQKDQSETDHLLFPKEPIADGGEWKLDAKAVAKELFDGAEIDEKASKVAGKLTGVTVENEVHSGKLELSCTLKLTAFPGTSVPFIEGGTVEVKVVDTRSLEPRRQRKTASKTTMALKGKAEQKGEAGEIKIDYELESVKEETTGDLPPAPPSKDEPKKDEPKK